MTLSPMTVLAIVSMGVATYLTRIGGLWLMRHLTLTPRIRAGLDAVPVAVLTAVITPALFLTGPAETAAGAVTALAALKLPLLGTIAVGVSAILAARFLIG